MVFADQSWTSKILSSKILITRSYCAYAVRGATCQLQSFSVYFAQLFRYGSQPIFSSFVEIWLQATRSWWSSLEISTFVIGRVCQQESAECVGKQGPRSEWAKGTTLRQALSRTEGRNRQAEHATVRLYAIVERWCGRRSKYSVARPWKLNCEKFSQGLSAKF